MNKTNETTNTIDPYKVVYSKIMERYDQHQKNAERHRAALEEEKYKMKLMNMLICDINDVTDVDDYNAEYGNVEYHLDKVFTSCIQSLNNLSKECSTIEYKCKMQMLEYVTALQKLLKSECDEKALEVFFISTI